MPAKHLDAHVHSNGFLAFRDPSEDDAWLATDRPEEIRP